MTTGTTGGSIVVRRSLGRRLKAAREAAKKTVNDVVTANLASKAKLFRIESGLVPVKVADVRALAWLYKLDEQTTEALAEMAANTASEGWWEDYGDVMPSWFSMYVELESAAGQLICYEPELVPGLLQVPGYTRAIGLADPDMTTAQVHRTVELRRNRQQAVFGRDHPLEVAAILGAGVLERPVGGSDVMDEQRRELLRMAEHGQDIRVLPWDAGAHAAMQGAFVILRFDDPDHPDLVYLETRAGGRYLHKDEVVEVYHRMFASILASSIPIKEYLR